MWKQQVRGTKLPDSHAQSGLPQPSHLGKTRVACAFAQLGGYSFPIRWERKPPCSFAGPEDRMENGNRSGFPADNPDYFRG